MQRDKAGHGFLSPSTRDGKRDTYCRPCRSKYGREHYEKHRQRYVDQAKQRKKALLRVRGAYLREYLKAHPCVDCGERDVVVLEFDHLGDKRFMISQGLVEKNWNEVLAEMEKCEVVCANCHRRRTATRGGFFRAGWMEEESG